MAQDVSGGTRRVSDRGIALIKRFEGCHLTAYVDPQSGGPPITIGFGSTRNMAGLPFILGERISQASADELLIRDLGQFCQWVLTQVRVPLSQGQLDGFTSFVYNLGPTKVRSSTAFRRLNSGDYSGCAEAMRWWISPGTRVERGLRLRREAEITLFNS